MPWRKLITLCCTLILFLSLVPLTAATTGTSDALDKVEPLVLQEIAADGQTEFFIWMTEHADLSAAYQLTSKEERGRFVFETLVEIAERTQASLRRYLDRQGVEYRAFYISNKILVRGADMDLLLEVAARSDVERITANHQYQLQEPVDTDPRPEHTQAVEPNISFIHADDVWAMGITGNGTVMAGNDTGLDETHPAVARHYRGCLNPPDCTSWDHNYNWWDATGTYPSNPDDGFGHGTHTTGTMVGDDGGSNQIGMAPGALTIHCKNMTDGGSGSDATFTECFEWDLAPWDLSGQNPDPAMAPDAVNNSWGYWGGGQNQFRDEILALHAAGILVEVSAGNEGSSCSSLRSPGDYHEVLTTGSVYHLAPYPGTITGFSSRGPSSLDGNYFPDIMAPGEDVRSCVPGGGYEAWSGTSMAGPHATALVGLCWSANPALRGMVEMTIDIITRTAVPLTGQGGSNCGGDYTTGPNNDWGYGTVDALAMVQECIAMGGAGHLDGTVTDSTTALPIEDARVAAYWDGGGQWTDWTDATGYYTMVVPAGTFTVTASAFGYLPDTVYGVVVITDQVTTQDLALTLAPEYVVSGTVSEAGSGLPLYAEVTALGTPLPSVWTDPATGYYSITVPEGTYTFRVRADLHMPEEREVVVDHSQTQDYLLDPLPCVLLVDDDGDNPDVRSYYATALDDLGIGYNVWDLSSQGDPGYSDLAGYQMVLWFTGYPWGSTFTGVNEAAVGAYLDDGGAFFLSSQDYLYDFGLTPFGQTYLHIASYDSDVSQTTVTGQNPYAGLGPYSLSYPFTNYSDIVNPDGQGVVAFVGNQGNAAVAYEGASFHTVFFGFPFEAISTLAGRVEVMEATLEFFGGCGCDAVTDPAFGWTPETPLEGQEVTFSGTASGTWPIAFEWDFDDGTTASGQVVNHTYDTAGLYTVVMTATNCGTATAVVSHEVTVEPCEEPSGLDFDWSPPAPVAGEEVTFNGTASGTLPIAFAWDLGDGTTGSGQVIAHTYSAAGDYRVVMTATNLCGEGTAAYTVTVEEPCAAVEILSVTAEVSGCQASFTAEVSGTEPFEWLWGFGDGMTSTLEMPVYEYGGTGVYTATLAVWNCGGQYGAEESFAVVVEECVAHYEIYLPLVYKNH